MGVQGRVVVSAIIGFDGHADPSSVQVVHRVDPDLDREAVADPEQVLAGMVEVLPEIEEVWGEVVRRFARLALER